MVTTTDSNPTNQAYKYCYVEHGPSRTICVGTDGYRMHVVQTQQLSAARPELEPFAYLIPAQPLQVFNKRPKYEVGSIDYTDTGWHITTDNDTPKQRQSIKHTAVTLSMTDAL